MFLVITIFMNFSLTAFANEKKIDSSVYNKNGKTSREELKTVIGTQTYNVVLDGKKTAAIDFYAIEEPWTKQTNPYSNEPEGDCIPTVQRIFAEIFGK